jgi:hypothetical protein
VTPWESVEVGDLSLFQPDPDGAVPRSAPKPDLLSLEGAVLVLPRC